MDFTWKKADISDLETLVKTRVEVLRAANKLDDSADMSEVGAQSRDYYTKALADDSHTAFLVYDGDDFIGAGGVSYYTVMPTYHNPSGRKAYIMNMYVRPEYRRQGIALKTLDMLVRDARERGVELISLEATDMGKPLYEKYGFVKMPDEYELPRE